MRRVGAWQVPLSVAAAGVAAAAGGAAARGLLAYDRDAIAAGEAWRRVTGPRAHLGPAHLALNLAGLGLVWLLVGERLPAYRWWLVVAFTIVFIDAAFWLLDPGLEWYVGLSGLLHGLLAAGVVCGFRTAPVESAVLALVLAGTLASEQLFGPLPGAEAARGGAVIVDAHLYGAVGGALAGALATYIMPARPSQHPNGGGT